MARITTIINQKGGVGKTTTAHALATGLTLKGKKTLAIDTDPQANLSYTMGADLQRDGSYELLKGQADPAAAIQHTMQGDIISSSLALAGADMEFTQTGREYMLQGIVKPLAGQYEYIIIDTPPTLGILTINALTAANDIIIPMGADIYSLQGLGQLHETIKKVRQYCNPALTIAGLLITRYNGRTILGKDLLASIQEAAKHIGANVYRSIIREGIAVKEAQAQQTNLYNLPKNNPGQDYLDFIGQYLIQRR